MAIRGHELRSQEVVAGQPELAGDAPNTAPQGESRDSGVGRGADGSCEPKGERFAVELAEQSTALDARHPGDRVDLHGAYRPRGRSRSRRCTRTDRIGYDRRRAPR